jgi:hypothetical protein
MADKLDWLDKHLILIRYLNINEAGEKENYKIRADLAEFFAGTTGTEEMVFKLAKAEKYKDACELLAYIAHKRAGVWWAYRCVLSLIEELQKNPDSERDIADIAKSFEVNVPDFAKVKLPNPPDTSKLDAALGDIKAKTAGMRAKADPTVMKMVDDAVAAAFGEFERVHGMQPVEMVKKLGAMLAQSPITVDPNSPMFKAKAELRAKLQAVRKDAIDTIKSVIPPKVPEQEKKIRDDALSAVYRWIAAPDEQNSKKCLNIGNECPGTPAGLLSLSAFWSFGNLMPEGDQVIITPPGLAANGLNQTLLMCALHKGGTRKLKERYELYFNIGVDVLSGRDNWEESLAVNKPPHTNIDTTASPTSPPDGAASGLPPEYKRWKPENGIA